MFGRPPVMLDDKDAFDPRPLPSPFIDVETLPDGLDALPDKLWPFCWFFLKQIKLALFLLIGMFTVAYILYGLLPLYTRDVIHILQATHDKAALWAQLKPVLISFVTYVVFAHVALFHGARFIWSNIAWTFRGLVVRQLTLYLQGHSINYFQSDFAGRLANKINDTADGIRSLMRDFIFALLYALVNCGLAIYLIAITGPEMFGAFAVYLVIYACILSHFIPIIVKASLRTQNSKTATTGQLVDVISNIYNVKIFSRTAFEDRRMIAQITDTSRKGRRMSFGFNKMYWFIEANTYTLWILSFGLMIWRIEHDMSSVADAALLVPVIMTMSQISWWMSDALVVFLETVGNVQDGIQTIVKPFALIDKKGAAALTVTSGRIDIDHVDFAYPGRPVFNDLQLTIPAGQKIGLVGPSGAGKSTLVQLLMRLHDIQGGVIKIDGHNIADVKQDSLRQQIAVIPQSSDLLHRTIRENIAYGRLDATDEEIMGAAQKAHAHDFIQDLRDHDGNAGYDAMVGERGVKLSGGQRQRIAIARAILKNAPILLLDEATSALDSESERLIQASLADLMKGRTVIAIAHRLSTIAKLDRLIVMENGAIAEDGTHAQLLGSKGLYAHLWALQSGGFLGDGHN